MSTLNLLTEVYQALESQGISKHEIEAIYISEEESPVRAFVYVTPEAEELVTGYPRDGHTFRIADGKCQSTISVLSMYNVYREIKQGIKPKTHLLTTPKYVSMFWKDIDYLIRKTDVTKNSSRNNQTISTIATALTSAFIYREQLINTSKGMA